VLRSTKEAHSCDPFGQVAYMVSYFPPISSLDVWLAFVHLAHNEKFVLGFFLNSLCSYVPSISSDNSE